MPRVLNMHYEMVLPDDIICDRTSKWGNPNQDAAFMTTDEMEKEYEQHVIESGLINDIEELRGKNLACWCAPRRCHCNVLLRLANA